MLRTTALAVLVLLVPPGPAAGSPAPAPGAPSSRAAPSPTWQWPVNPPRTVVRPFVAPATPYAAGHRGVDIGALDGLAYAPAAGVVSFVGTVVDRPVLSIRHPGGLVSSYEPLQSSLVTGQEVGRGDPIGTVLPGHCSSLCLHVGVRLDGQYVSPLLYLGGIPHSVLLPTRWPP